MEVSKDAEKTFQFEYEQLDKSKKEIRLFKLKSKNFKTSNDGTIFGELENVLIESKPKYTALSYVWGSNSSLCKIYVGDTLFQISSNLGFALKELRKPDEDIILWIDQLCINQKDENEKTHQVQQMREIYSQAQLVISWLGPAKNDSDYALECLDKLAEERRLKKNFFLKNHDHETRSMCNDIMAKVIPTGDQKIIDRFSKAFSGIFQRRYWARVWVLQEFVVATNLQIRCGASILPDDSFLRVILLLDFIRVYGRLNPFGTNGSDSSPSESQDLVSRIGPTIDAALFAKLVVIAARRISYQRLLQGLELATPRHSLFAILCEIKTENHENGRLRCSDPRDLIFARLGLANDTNDFEEFPDYSMPTQEVYIQAARNWLKQGLVDILSFGSKSPDLPTWVPNWASQSTKPNFYAPSRMHISKVSASGQTFQKQNISYPDARSLTLLGIKVDRISRVGNVWSPRKRSFSDLWGKQGKFWTFLRDLQNFVKESQRISIKDKDETTARISVADFHGRLQLLDKKVHEDLIKRYSEALTDPEGLGKSGFGPTYGFPQYLQVFWSLRPFISSTGYVGLATPDALIDDIICVFFGARIPVVLRPQADGTYVVIGEAFVHGAMYGELVEEEYVTESFTLI